MNLKILSFNWHEPYLCLLSRIGHEFLIVEPELAPGTFRRWDENMRPLPENARCLSPDEARRLLEENAIDLVISHNVKDLVFVHEFPLPKIHVFHNRLTTEIALSDTPVDRKEYLNKLRPLLEGVSRVFISQSKKDDWGLEGEVILPGLDIADYGGYTGEQEGVLRVGNLLRERDLMMGFEAGQKLLAGFPAVTLGMNPTLPGARLSQGFADLLAHYRELRVYLNCTVDGYEDGYNLSMLEAMAAGMPVVSTFNHSSPIEDGVNGYISKDIDTLRSGIETLLHDPRRAREMGARARETVREKFGMHAYLTSWLKVVQDTVVRFLEGAGISLKQDRRPFYEKPRKNILLNYVSYPATTAFYLERALRKHHNVITCGPMITPEIIRQWNLEALPREVTPQDIPATDGAALATLCESLPQGWQPDLFLWVETGLGTPPPDLAEHSIPKACYLIDTHIHLEKHKQIARNFDFVFLAQNGYIDVFKESGIENVTWLPLACDPEIHGPGKECKKTHDVGFVGSVTETHTRRVELLSAIGKNFKLCRERKFLEEMAQVHARSRIVFNNAVNHDLNMRVFEALASGSLLVTDAACGLDELFEDRKHFVRYEDATLIETIRYYIEHPEERERIAAAGRKEVLARHTYEHRARFLLEMLDAHFRRTGEGASPAQPAGYYHNVREDVLALIPEEASCILEIGCAAGATGRELKRRKDVFVAGVEVEAEAAAQARQVLDDVVEGDIEALELPYEEGSFDCVLFADVLEHLVDPQAVLQKIKNLLRPDGTVVASIPNVQFFGLIHHLVEGNWTYQEEGILDRTHLRFFTFKEMQALFARAGFEIQAVEETLDPQYASLSQQEASRFTMGRLTIENLTPEELRRFFVFQYKIRAGLKLPVTREIPEPGRAEGLQKRLAEAQVLFDRGEFTAAAESCRKIQTAFPECAEAFAREGNCRMHLKEPEAARGLYEQALQLDAGQFVARLGLGLLYLQAGSLEEAGAELEAAVRIRPESDKALCALGLASRVAGRTREGMDCFARALESNIDNPTALSGLLELSYELNEFAVVEDALKRFLKLHPANLDMLFGLAGVQYKRGRRSECRATLDLILVFDPKHRDALQFLQQMETAPVAAGLARK